MKKEIDHISDQIIQDLKEREKKCKSNLAKIEKINLDELKNVSLPSWKQKFRLPNVNDELNYFLLLLNDNVKIMQNHKIKYENSLLMNQSIQFNKYENSSLFGKLIIEHIDQALSIDFGKLIRDFNKNGHTKLIRSIQVDEKSNKIISASEDDTIKIWNLKTGECLKTMTDHKGWVTSILILPNNILISGSCDETIKIWDLNSYKCLNTLINQSRVYSICLISDNQIACGSRDGSINIWNFENSIKVKSFKAHDQWIPYLLSVDKTKFISCSGEIDKKIKIWNSKTFDCIKSLEGHTNKINHLELLSNINLISCSDDSTVKLWHIESGELLKSIQFNHWTNCAKVLNNNLLAISFSNGQIQLYDLNKMKTIKSLLAHSSFVYRLHLLSNGNLLSSSENGEIKLSCLLE